jgi:hypothetical protein
VILLTNLRTQGAISNTEGNAAIHATTKLRSQLIKKFWKPWLTTVNTKVTMHATIIDVISENKQ